MAVLKLDLSVPVRAPLVILFAETRGYTRMSEKLKPSVVLAHAAEFFALVSAAVERHAGTVSNLFNDTLAATFAVEGSARLAAQAAQEILRDFGSLAEAWERDCGIHAAVAMGLHRGDAVIGRADGALFKQPLIVGDSVSIAERLLHRARAGELLLSKAVMDALAAARFAIETEEVPPLQLPRRESIQVYGVLLDRRLDFT